MFLARVALGGRAVSTFRSLTLFRGHGVRGTTPVWRVTMATKAEQIGHVSEPLMVGKAPPRLLKKDETRRILSLARPEAWKLTGAVILLFASSSITMAVPFALGRVIDLIYTSDPETMRSNINRVCGTILAIFLIGGLCNFGRVYLMNMSAQRITKTVREKLFRSIIRQEVAFFDQTKTGELVNRLSSDTSLVSQCVTTNISDGLRSFIMVGTGISMMFYMSPILASVSLCVVPPIAGMAIIYGRFIKKMTTQVQDALADATQLATERISNIRTVKSFNKENSETKGYGRKLDVVLNLATKQSLAMGIFFGCAGFSGNAIALIVLYSGGVMVSDNSLTVGGLSAFLLYAAYVGASIGGLSSFYSELNKGLGASTRIWELMDREPAIPFTGGLRPPSEPRGEIRFCNVDFSYPCRSDRLILRNCNLLLSPGTVTAVVGASGSGKTTLGLLLLGLYKPSAGSVTVDGYSVDDLDLSWLRDSIGTVAQEPVLFSGTIRENVLYGASDGMSVSDADIFSVLKEANAFNFVTKDLPLGLDTLVGERGIMLSGGQKQRVAIARALIKKPRILLLDEATSALDAESEHLVQEALERILKGRTVLTIAHRLSTIRNADQIAVLEEGQIAEIGTFDELMNSESGVFRNLVRHQAFHPA